MSERPEYRLGEYESVVLEEHRLTDADLAHLRGLTRSGRLSAAAVPRGWRIRAAAAVGVVALDRIRVVVEPKLAITGEQLITWLCYALRTPMVPLESLRRWKTGPSGFTELVVAALLAECRALAADGLRRGYVSDDRVAPVLRGRLNAAAQLTRRYGMVDRLHVRAHERDTGIWENRVCGTALAAAARSVQEPHLLRALADTGAAFPRYHHPNAAADVLTRARYTRLNYRYRPAHAWAALVLGGGGVADLLANNGWQAGALLLDMPALWEAVVSRACERAVRRLGGKAVPSVGERALTVSGDLRGRHTFRPDVLLDLGAETGLVPVDAKYKDYGRVPVSTDDLHQLLTYSAAFAPEHNRKAVIVYPDVGGSTQRTLNVGGSYPSLGSITVAGLDTTAAPERAEERIATLLSGLDRVRRPGPDRCGGYP
ncbi:McrC family protein [Allosalinactinospora lopnorensis]|uniref:McrC family protein n=1 Tax=Allosalinactinospora lopnorensis TaxID=1352348 RepID=UPI000623D701|nr:hypothetical protein [Allosalinactinospora lopnorensis]